MNPLINRTIFFSGRHSFGYFIRQFRISSQNMVTVSFIINNNKIMINYNNLIYLLFIN